MNETVSHDLISLLCLSHAPSFPISADGPSWGKYTYQIHVNTHIPQEMWSCWGEERGIFMFLSNGGTLQSRTHWEAEPLQHHALFLSFTAFCTSPTVHSTFLQFYDIACCKKCHLGIIFYPKNHPNGFKMENLTEKLRLSYSVIALFSIKWHTHTDICH